MYQLSLKNLAPKNIYSLSPHFYGKRNDGQELSFTNYYAEIDGKPFFGISGEIHFSRIWEEYWEDEIIKMKNGGINIAAFYVFWIHHEEVEGTFDFSGRRNLRKFVSLCAKHGLYAIIRMGPFCHGEVRNGGIPDWLYGKPCEVRSLDEVFLSYTKRLYEKLAKELEGLFYKDGGPIIAAQVDNEYQASAAPWEYTAGLSNEWVPSGHDGTAYLLRLRDIAREAGIDVPCYTCTAWGTPIPEDIMPLSGGYAFRPWIFYPYNNNTVNGEHPPTEEYIYRDNHNSKALADRKHIPSYDIETLPYFCCEMGGGMNCSYHYRFRLPWESVDAMANMKLASGCNLLGYYMYHGGTNPKGTRAVFLNESEMPKLSYDFQAPLGEFGQARPSYHRLRSIHLLVKTFEQVLCGAKTVVPEEGRAIDPKDTDTLRFAVRLAQDGSGFLFINNFQDHIQNKKKEEETIVLHLPDKDILIQNISLAAGENCILPFNMNIRGIPFLYALAQPLTILDAGQDTYAFFLIPEGMKPAYYFGEGVIAEKEFGAVDIPAAASAACSSGEMTMFSVSLGGKKLHIVTLTRQQSLGFYQVHWRGAPALILTNGTLLASHDSLRIEHYCKKIDFAVFPEKAFPIPSGAGFCGKSGPFAAYHLEQESRDIPVTLKDIGQGRYIADIPSWDETQVKDVILQIRYEGDIGHAFIDGDLIADNFWNGAVWEIGLREFSPRLKKQPLVFYITPVKKESRVVIDAVTAARKEDADGAIGHILQVETKIIYEWDIS